MNKENLEKEELENEEGQEEQLEQKETEQDANYWKAQAEKYQSKYEKVAGRYKSVKKAEKQSSSNEESVSYDLEERIFQRVNFYQANPKASEHAEFIEKLVNENGLSRERAYKLVIAEKDPNELLDEQKRNQNSSGANAMQGAAAPVAESKEMNTENIKNAQSVEELDALIEAQL